MIVAHTPPSGDPAPSPEDVAFARRLREAGTLLGIDVVDRPVVGAGRAHSIRQRSDPWACRIRSLPAPAAPRSVRSRSAAAGAACLWAARRTWSIVVWFAPGGAPLRAALRMGVFPDDAARTAARAALLP